MRYLVTLISVLLLVLASCSHETNPPPDSPECAGHRFSLTIYGNEDFSPDERAAIEGAAEDWRAFSGGKIDLVVEFRSVPSDVLQISRAVSTDQLVKDQDVFQAENRKVPGFVSFGWTQHSPPRLYLVVDRIPPGQLRHLATHELGHVAQLRWPDCVDDGRQLCIHSPDPAALMAGQFSGNPLGPSDREFCHASCLCSN